VRALREGMAMGPTELCTHLLRSFPGKESGRFREALHSLQTLTGGGPVKLARVLIILQAILRATGVPSRVLHRRNEVGVQKVDMFDMGHPRRGDCIYIMDRWKHTAFLGVTR
jgi:hypothetical protein